MTTNQTDLLHVLRVRNTTHATCNKKSQKTQHTDATPAQQTSLKALAEKVLARNGACNTGATGVTTARNKLCNKSGNLGADLLHVHIVLTKLASIRPYRVHDVLMWRGDASPEQQALLWRYESELIDVLRPRAFTPFEEEVMALWLHDIGETAKPERDAVFCHAIRSPAERVALLWMAEGSPEYRHHDNYHTPTENKK